MTIIAFLQVFLSTSLLIYSITLRDAHGKDFYHLFRDYIKKYNKSYVPGTSEYLTREAIFEATLRRIERLNGHRDNNKTVIYGITQFSDMTPEEFESHMHINRINTTKKYGKRKVHNLRRTSSSFRLLPQKMDWRDKNVVTEVRNQDKCGACWAFSTVETIETMYALRTGNLVDWSVQQLIDCAPTPNQGCEGGDTCLAIEWLYQDKINLVLEKDYPFIDDTGLCKFKKSGKTVRVSENFTCDSFVGDEDQMLKQLAFHGPLVAAVDATGWQDYLGGIIQSNCDDDRNHAVQIVGYDLTGDIPYYIVRNSWGTTFGNDGYLNIAVGKNMCGIAEEVSSLNIL